MTQGVYKRTPEHLEMLRERARKMQQANIGRKHKPEVGQKISLSKKGRRRKFTKEWIENLRKASIRAGCKPPSSLGRKWTKEQRANFKKANFGKRPRLFGDKNPNWKGGKISERHKLMSRAEYKNWRKSVFERDNYTCQHCGQYGGKLNADHELPWSDFPDLRFEVLNGRTLCLNCHRKIPTVLNPLRLDFIKDIFPQSTDKA